jgi:hypothetical protein
MYITQRNRVILISEMMGASLHRGEKGAEKLLSKKPTSHHNEKDNLEKL